MFSKDSTLWARAALPVWSLGVCLAAAWTALGQDRTTSLAGEDSAARAARRELPPGYNIRWGPTVWFLAANTRAEYTDNVTLTERNRRQDLTLLPELKIQGLWPVTDQNTLTLALGLGYAYYLKTTQLNSDTPLVSPDSELTFKVYAGDFRFRARERFSYWESIFFWSAIARGSGAFVNLNNIGKFGRLENSAGLTVDWDLHDLILTLDYEHNTFLARVQALDYLSRAAERVNLTADFYLAPKIRTGLEGKVSWTDYSTDLFSDHWRYGGGPFADVMLSPYFQVRVGGGYSGIGLTRSSAGGDSLSHYYGYVRVSHLVNRWLKYSLAFEHSDDYGWEGPNAEGTSISLAPTVSLIRNVDLSLYSRLGFVQEQAGTSQEDYTYGQAGLRLGWHFAKRWTALFGYDFVTKESSVPFLGYFQNRVSVGAEFRF